MFCLYYIDLHFITLIFLCGFNQVNVSKWICKTQNVICFMSVFQWCAVFYMFGVYCYRSGLVSVVAFKTLTFHLRCDWICDDLRFSGRPRRKVVCLIYYRQCVDTEVLPWTGNNETTEWTRLFSRNIDNEHWLTVTLIYHFNTCTQC